MIPIITGSDGYIGTNLTNVFKKHNKSFIGLDRKSGPDLLSHEGRVQFQTRLYDADVVIHLAAVPRIPASWYETDKYIRDNIELTEYVAKCCSQYNCHLIFASSSSVYGNGNGPLNPYAWTKKAGEDIIKLYGQNNLEYTIARIFTTYGNNGPLVLDTWLKQTLNGQPITVRGDGSQMRDFIHVEDVASVLYSLYLKKLDKITLDIGTGVSHSLNNLASYYTNNTVQEPELAGYAHSTKADADYTKVLLNWTPEYSAVDWIKSSLDKSTSSDG
jgi:UDP-glucose 4-epimerase